MGKATPIMHAGDGAPVARPRRCDLLASVLGGTRRSFVPVRRIFLQLPEKSGKSRGSVLASLTRPSSALDSYLLIHALASSSEPHVADSPAATWAQVARLDESASFESAKSHWSKVVAKLSALRLIESERKGNRVRYRLLNEAGGGEAYTRPKNSADGRWFRLPYSYWLEEFDKKLEHSEKLMLLISLSLPEVFSLPINQVFNWYGISEATARRGLRGLKDKGILARTVNHRVDPRSPTGWVEEFRYALQGSFSRKVVGELPKMGTIESVKSVDA